MKKILICLLLIVAILGTGVGFAAGSYHKAIGLIESGDYQGAYDILTKLDFYDGAKAQLEYFYWIPDTINHNGEVWTHEYNEDGLPTKVIFPDGTFDEYFYDDQYRNIGAIDADFMGGRVEEIYEFDENGNMIRSEYLTDGMVGIAVVDYNDNGQPIKTEYFFDFGLETEEYFIEHVYDENGRFCHDVYHFSEDNIYTSSTAYDEKGNLICHISPDFLGGVMNEIFIYDDENRVICDITNYDSTVFSRYDITYDEHGNIVRYQFSDESGIISIEELFYDEHGNLIKHIETDSNGNAIVTTITYHLAYIPTTFENGVTWTLYPFLITR